MRRTLTVLAAVLLLACGEDRSGSVPMDAMVDAARDAEGAAPDRGLPDAEPRPDQGAPDAAWLRVMTFNGGTTDGLPHDADREDGYTSAHAAIADALYENSLSWNPAEAALTAFLADAAVDIVVFQEIFYDPWCADIEVDPELDFVCRDWVPSRPWQVARLLGPAFQVACADGQPDNCLGVRRTVGTLRGCPLDAPCEGGLSGTGPRSGCSRGARVGRVVIDLADGGELVVVNAHGTSGFGLDDQACRVDQFRQIFEDAGEGSPAADGALNLVMGDFNTDPVVLAPSDPSAAALVELVEAHGFHFVSPTARDAPATYRGVPLRIDHVISDGLFGACVIPGASDGVPAVMETVYWDHRPVICDVSR